VLFHLICIPLKPIYPRGNLSDDVLYPLKIVFCLVEPLNGLFAAVAVECDAGGLLKQGAPLLRAKGQGRIDNTLTDNRIGPLAEAALCQQLLDVAEENLRAIHQVLILTGPIGTA